MARCAADPGLWAACGRPPAQPPAQPTRASAQPTRASSLCDGQSLCACACPVEFFLTDDPPDAAPLRPIPTLPWPRPPTTTTLPWPRPPTTTPRCRRLRTARRPPRGRWRRRPLERRSRTTSPLPPRSANDGSKADGARARVSTTGDGVAMMAWAWRTGDGVAMMAWAWRGGESEPKRNGLLNRRMIRRMIHK